MGWDAYAVRPEVDPRISDEEFLSPELLEVFRAASEELVRKAGRGSDNLGSGTLGGLSKGILVRATGIADEDLESREGGLMWAAETVRRADHVARWDFAWPEDDDLILRTEARIFLKTCAAHGRAIWFDW